MGKVGYLVLDRVAIFETRFDRNRPKIHSGMHDEDAPFVKYRIVIEKQRKQKSDPELNWLDDGALTL